MIEERKYQTDDVNAAMDHGIDDRPIHCAPTGSGKTVIQALIAKRELAIGNRTAILTPRNEIFGQTHGLVTEICGAENVTMLRAKRQGETWNPMARIHICSWPTMIARAKKSDFFFPRVERVLVDECHLSMAPKILEILEHYAPKAVIDGYTATPARQTGMGLGRYFTTIKHVTSVRRLTKAGYLAPIEYWGGATPEMQGIKIRRGDYEVKKLSDACSVLVGDAVDNWLRLASDRHTIVFAVDIAHCEMLAHKFKQVGVNAASLHVHMDQADRDRTNEQFKAGQIQVLVNVGIACLDEKTEILTSSGWVGHQEITADHEIANWDQGQIFFEKPIAINVRDRKPDERMVFLETKNRSIRVTENHRMLYRTWVVGKFKEAKAHEIIDKACQLPICGVAEPFPVAPAQEQHKKRKLWQNAYMLRQAGFVGDARKEAERRAKDRDSLRYADPQDLSTAECEFIGFWLGDGSKTKQKCGSVVYSLSQSKRYLGIISWIDQMLETLGLDFRRRIQHDKREDRLALVQWTMPRGTGFGPQKRNGVYYLEPYLNKNGSKLYWGLNDQQFSALMRGFWMADGNHRKAAEPKNDRWRIDNTNKQLLNLLQSIACCRGYRANLHRSKQNEQRGHKPLYRLSVSRRAHHSMTKYRLQYESDYQEEKVWCVRSHSGFIVTRRRGTVTVMGNSYGYDAPSVNCIQICRPTKSIVLHLQMIGRGMRPKVDGSELMVLDHAGNVPALGQADDLFRWRLDDGQKACENWSKQKDSGEAEDAKVHKCQECNYLFSRSRACPKCGWKVPFTKRDVKATEADLVLIGKSLVKRLPEGFPEHEIFFQMLKHYAHRVKYSDKWSAAQFKEKCGIWPPFHWNDLARIPPNKRVKNYITSRRIAYAKGRQKAAPG